jgi:hypothetical protein
LQEGGITFRTGADVLRLIILTGGAIGIGTSTTPTAALHIKAGTATASTAPLKFTSGVSMTAAEAGAVEYTTDDLFFTIATGTARKRLLMGDPVGGLTTGRVPFTTTNGRVTDSSALTYTSSQFNINNTATALGVGFASGGFTSANNVVEFKATNSRWTFNNNAGANPVFAMFCTGGKAVAHFVDTTGAATIFDSAGNFDFTTDSAANLAAYAFGGGTSRLRVKGTGEVGIGLTSPTAALHIKAGTATASTAPLKFTSGALMTAPEAGAVEFLTDRLYVTQTTGTTRRELQVKEDYTQAFLLGGM